MVSDLVRILAIEKDAKRLMFPSYSNVSLMYAVAHIILPQESEKRVTQF